MQYKKNLHKIGLGTVQFGTDYGIANPDGQTSPEEALRIIESASKYGIRTIDTARLYGNSEDVLGQIIKDHSQFDIVTKTIPFKKDVIDDSDIQIVTGGFDQSLLALHTHSVYGVLLHHADDLKSRGAEKLYEVLWDFKKSGRVQKIGISAYDQEQIDYILLRFDIDLIQIPVNIFDHRLIESGTVQKLKERGVEIHVRSAFLQGIVFMKPDDLPKKLSGFRPYLNRLEELSKDHKTSKSAIALAFLFQNADIDKIICGFNNMTHLESLADTVKYLPDLPQEIFQDLRIDDKYLLNPSLW